MKTAIVYYSRHHENTLKLLRAIKEADPDVTLIDALEGGDLSGYDAVGFASGIYYSKFHKSVIRMAQEQLPEGKKTFFLYTYGAKKDGYTMSIRAAAITRKADILGEYGCYGFNTFGPFKLIGGIAKERPNEQDIRGAVAFYKGLFRGGD
ncbi:MAG: flavodoxin [Candidatus Ventricola sp.]